MQTVRSRSLRRLSSGGPKRVARIATNVARIPAAGIIQSRAQVDFYRESVAVFMDVPCYKGFGVV